MTTKSRVKANREDRYIKKLTPEQKVYVIKRLAAYESSGAIARDLKALFGLDVTVQSVDHYHPERAPTAPLAPCWKELFWESRRAYITACAEAGTMEKMVRVRLRENMVLMARDAGHYRIANELLDSIAKEAGAMFERRLFVSANRDAQPTPRMCTPEDRVTTILQDAEGNIKDVTVGTPGGPLAVVRLTDGEWPEQAPLPEKQLPEPEPPQQ